MQQMVKEEFSLDRLNIATEADDMSAMEMKHHPVIERPHQPMAGEAFQVWVKPGALMEHPNELAHFIQWVELYAGERFLGRAEFSPTVTNPKACFELCLDEAEELVAYSMCNLHGLWKNTSVLRLRTGSH